MLRNKRLMKCDKCNGQGRWLNPMGIWVIIFMPQWETCPKCNGSGNIRPEDSDINMMLEMRRQRKKEEANIPDEIIFGRKAKKK